MAKHSGFVSGGHAWGGGVVARVSRSGGVWACRAARSAPGSFLRQGRGRRLRLCACRLAPGCWRWGGRARSPLRWADGCGCAALGAVLARSGSAKCCSLWGCLRGRRAPSFPRCPPRWPCWGCELAALPFPAGVVAVAARCAVPRG